MSSRSGDNQIVVMDREKHEEYLKHIGDFHYIRDNIESRKENIRRFMGDTDSQKKGLLDYNKNELIGIISGKGYFMKAKKHYTDLSYQHNKGYISDEEIKDALNNLDKIIKYFEGEEKNLEGYGIKLHAKSSAKSASKSRTKQGGSIIKRLLAKPVKPIKPKAKPVKPIKPKAKPVKPIKPKAKPVKPKAKPIKPKAKPVKAK
jgi:hypothetical protein